MSVPVRSFEVAGAEVLIFADVPAASRFAADRIAQTIVQRVKEQGKAVLGLATGGTPKLIYERLVELHRAGELSFAKVSTYNLDEYYPLFGSDPNSYRNYMQMVLFDRVDIAPNRAHVLDGTVPEAFIPTHTAEFDRWIASEGNLDLQLLGIGRNGHIGFNEPSKVSVDEAIALTTRLVSLHPVTIADAAKDFGSESNVIRHALTLGIAQILAARKILILAFGAGKAPAVTAALKGPITAELPASLLQKVAGKVTWLLDESAAAGLS